MATFPIRTLSILCIASFLISTSSSIDPFNAFFTSPSPSPPTDKPFYSVTSSFSPILSHLGFQDFSAAVPSLAADSSVSWNGPSTIFAPSDVSLRTCLSCFVPDLLREHTVPGLFTADYLRSLPIGTKIETLSPGRCVTITSENVSTKIEGTAIFVGGLAVTRPDLFNNGLMVVHGIQSYIYPLYPFSCDVDGTMVIPGGYYGDEPVQSRLQTAIMRLMLREVMMRLRNSGFSVLSLAMKVKYAELVTLNNMTVFALEDASIFNGSHGYINKVRFHIVPNQLLTIRDLESLPEGTLLPTLETGKSLVITTAGGSGAMRINFVKVKTPDVMRNMKIVVHGLLFPFPRVDPEAAARDGLVKHVSDPDVLGYGAPAGSEACTEAGNCVVPVSVNLGEVPHKPTVEIEDHHGL